MTKRKLLRLLLITVTLISIFSFTMMLPMTASAAQSKYTAWVFLYKWGWVYAGQWYYSSSSPGWHTATFNTLLGTAKCPIYWSPGAKPYHTSVVCKY